jgi:hypothetical protein
MKYVFKYIALTTLMLVYAGFYAEYAVSRKCHEFIVFSGFLVLVGAVGCWFIYTVEEFLILIRVKQRKTQEKR